MAIIQKLTFFIFYTSRLYFIKLATNYISNLLDINIQIKNQTALTVLTILKTINLKMYHRQEWNLDIDEPKFKENKYGKPYGALMFESYYLRSSFNQMNEIRKDEEENQGLNRLINSRIYVPSNQNISNIHIPLQIQNNKPINQSLQQSIKFNSIFDMLKGLSQSRQEDQDLQQQPKISQPFRQVQQQIMPMQREQVYLNQLQKRLIQIQKYNALAKKIKQIKQQDLQKEYNKTMIDEKARLKEKISEQFQIRQMEIEKIQKIAEYALNIRQKDLQEKQSKGIEQKINRQLLEQVTAYFQTYKSNNRLPKKLLTQRRFVQLSRKNQLSDEDIHLFMLAKRLQQMIDNIVEEMTQKDQENSSLRAQNIIQNMMGRNRESKLEIPNQRIQIQLQQQSLRSPFFRNIKRQHNLQFNLQPNLHPNLQPNLQPDEIANPNYINIVNIDSVNINNMSLENLSQNLILKGKHRITCKVSILVIILVFLLVLALQSIGQTNQGSYSADKDTQNQNKYFQQLEKVLQKQKKLINDNLTLTQNYFFSQNKKEKIEAIWLKQLKRKRVQKSSNIGNGTYFINRNYQSGEENLINQIRRYN